MILSSLFLIAGCAEQHLPIDTAARFCDVEEKRHFTAAEVQWRKANAPENLKLDLKTNLTFERECEAGERSQ